jgi:hypothetical protein
VQLVLVVLKVISALLRCPSRQLLGNDLPVAAVLSKELDEFLLFVSLPLVLGLDTTSKKGRLIYRAADVNLGTFLRRDDRRDLFWLRLFDNLRWLDINKRFGFCFKFFLDCGFRILNKSVDI